MTATELAALITGITGIVAAVTALIAQIRHNANPTAHK